MNIDGICIDNDERENRFSMYVPFKNSKNTNQVLVIMRNPSKANKNESDMTINNVLNFCHDKYSGVFFANLFPFYETEPNNLKEHIQKSDYKNLMDRNERAINDLLSVNPIITEVIVAWGTNESNLGGKYQEAINCVLQILKNHKKSIFAMRFISSITPWHPRNWGSKGGGYELELYEWGKKNSF